MDLGCELAGDGEAKPVQARMLSGQQSATLSSLFRDPAHDRRKNPADAGFECRGGADQRMRWRRPAPAMPSRASAHSASEPGSGTDECPTKGAESATPPMAAR